MTRSRVEIFGPKEFNPREWLRREVLWASLMSPYTQQLDTWADGTALDQHMGNVTRQHLYMLQDDPESQSLGFFNQGKNVAGLISFAALFDACQDRAGAGAHVNIPGVQARTIDEVLARATDGQEIKRFSEDEEREEFEECAAAVQEARQFDFGEPERNERFKKAGSIMLSLAAAEAASWVANSRQDAEGQLPVLTIPDGGFPRSGGDRVERLQPIFHEHLESANYHSFS